MTYLLISKEIRLASLIGELSACLLVASRSTQMSVSLATFCSLLVISASIVIIIGLTQNSIIFNRD